MELDAICLRKNGPIKEDIGAFSILNEKDIKSTYMEKKKEFDSLLKLPSIPDDKKTRIIELLTQLIYLRNYMSPLFVRCKTNDINKLSQRKDIDIIKNNQFLKIMDNIESFKEKIKDEEYNPKIILIKKKRNLLKKVQNEPLKSNNNIKKTNSKKDKIFIENMVLSLIDNNFIPPTLNYKDFLNITKTHRLNKAGLENKMVLKDIPFSKVDDYETLISYYNLDVTNMFYRKHKKSKYNKEFKQYHQIINDLINENDKNCEETFIEKDSLLQNTSYTGYVLFYSDDNLSAKEKVYLFYDICRYISSTLLFTYTYIIRNEIYNSTLSLIDNDKIAGEFFKKFNYFTVMYDWEEFKNIENKPKKIDIFTNFLNSYIITCDKNNKFKEFNEKKESYDEIITEKKLKKVEFIEKNDDTLKRKKADNSSNLYDKYSMEFIHDIAEYIVKIYPDLSKSKLIINLSILYVIPLIESYYEELISVIDLELLDAISEANKRSDIKINEIPKKDFNKIKNSIIKLRKQLIRLGYIYFTFFKYINIEECKEYKEYNFSFDKFFEYINEQKKTYTSDTLKEWYLKIIEFYKKHIEKLFSDYKKKNYIEKLFSDYKNKNILRYFSILNELYKICDYVYIDKTVKKYSPNRNPFNMIPISKNSKITHYFNNQPIDLMDMFDMNFRKNSNK